MTIWYEFCTIANTLCKHSSHLLELYGGLYHLHVQDTTRECQKHGASGMVFVCYQEGA
jgi:hypothetical protein